MKLLYGPLFILICTDAIKHDFCHWESFKATCAVNQILYIKSAIYGRMEMHNRCIKRDFGYVGCKADVLSKMHSLCSGKKKCEFPTPELHENRKCPEDLTAYLLTNYSCLDVVSCQTDLCQKSDYLRVTVTSGFLSSEMTSETGCGREKCPWFIEVDPGQRINLTLHNFAKFSLKLPGKVCWKYATIKDDTMIDMDLTVCSDSWNYGLEQHIILSQTNRLSIVLHSPSNRGNPLQYAIQFEAVGCPKLISPKYAHVVQKSEEAFVICNHTKLEYKLICRDSIWEGKVGDCAEGFWLEKQIADNDQDNSLGMLLIIGLGVTIGIVIGTLLLGAALFCVKVRHNSIKHPGRPVTRLLKNNFTKLNDHERKKDENLHNSIHTQSKHYTRAASCPSAHYIAKHSIHMQHQASLISSETIKNNSSFHPFIDGEIDSHHGTFDHDHVYETPLFVSSDNIFQNYSPESFDQISGYVDCETDQSCVNG